MDSINQFFQWTSNHIWGVPMIVLLFGTHLYFTIRLRFIQRFIGKGIRLSVAKDPGAPGDVSQFGALVTALAATIGTGNIVGVSTAVAMGGPGAVLWCWLTGVFGISTKYAEGLLAVKYRVQTSNGAMLGGPMYALERGLGKKWLGVVFAVLTAVAAFGIGNMVQANSIADLAQANFHLPTWVTGLLLAVCTALVILGGIQSIARVCTAFVPIMAVGYVAGCLIILVIGYATLPDTIALIFKSAFTGHAAVGGFAGAGVMAALRFGTARGLFSNESGMGSAPIVAAAARTSDPVRQALVSATGTFWDTVVVCAITGLVVVNSGAWTEGLKGSDLTRSAFATLPHLGPAFLVFGLLTFVFSTIIGWEYYGERAVEYLFGKKAILPYRLAWVGAVVVGALVSVPLVWNFADTANALMVLPNVLSLLLLSGVIVKETRERLWHR